MTHKEFLAFFASGKHGVGGPLDGLISLYQYLLIYALLEKMDQDFATTTNMLGLNIGKGLIKYVFIPAFINFNTKIIFLVRL